VSSRRRPYLNLKQSMVEFFKTPAHYLKEFTGKWSIFDKPYLDQDYRTMHLDLPIPDWGRPRIEPGLVGPSIWPRKLGKTTWIFSEGNCSLTTFGGDCGESIIISGSVWRAFFFSGPGTVSWSVTSSDSELARIEEIEPHTNGTFVSISVQLSDVKSGTATICAEATMVGLMTKEVAYENLPWKTFGGWHIAPGGWSPSLEYSMANLPYLYVKRKEVGWDCGCVDIEVVCECEGASWDTDASAKTVAPDSFCSVAIKDASGGSRTWTVGGTGAWLDAEFTKTSLTNQANSVTIYTDVTACGSISVSACGATGYVRCTVGQWGAWTVICQDPHYPGSCPSSNQCSEILGNRQNMACRQCTAADTCTCVGTQLCDPPGSGWPPCDDFDCNYPDCFCSGGLQQPPDPGTWGVTISQYRFWECP